MSTWKKSIKNLGSRLTNDGIPCGMCIVPGREAQEEKHGLSKKVSSPLIIGTIWGRKSHDRDRTWKRNVLRREKTPDASTTNTFVWHVPLHQGFFPRFELTIISWFSFPTYSLSLATRISLSRL